jgi:hypothetical protein
VEPNWQEYNVMTPSDFAYELQEAERKHDVPGRRISKRRAVGRAFASSFKETGFDFAAVWMHPRFRRACERAGVRDDVLDYLRTNDAVRAELKYRAYYMAIIEVGNVLWAYLSGYHRQSSVNRPMMDQLRQALRDDVVFQARVGQRLMFEIGIDNGAKT